MRHSTLARVAPSLYNLRFYKHANPRGWKKHIITNGIFHSRSRLNRCQRHHMFIEKPSSMCYSTLARVAPSLHNLRFYKHANPPGWKKHIITNGIFHSRSRLNRCQWHHMFIEKPSSMCYSTLARVAPSLYNLRFYKHTNPRGWKKHIITNGIFHSLSRLNRCQRHHMFIEITCL
jgi:hypothetical protein